MNKTCYEIKNGEEKTIDIDLNGEFDDIFIFAASFEERGATIANRLDKNYKCKNCIVYYNEDNQYYEENLNTIKEQMTSRTLNPIKEIKGNHRDTKIKYSSMIELAEYCRQNKGQSVTNVVIDITGFTKIDLIVLLDFLTAYVDDLNVKLLYVSPEEHGDWLSKGHSTICNIPGFCGNHDVLKKTALIVLSGFEKERAKNLIEEYEPHEVYLGFSSPGVQPEFELKNKELQSELLNYPNVTSFDFSAKEMSTCYESIRRLVDEIIDDYNIVIAPLCTKLSAVACFKVAKDYPDIQLVYCFPQEYNYVSYSYGSKKIFVEYVNL